jgi:hypothetical protein
VKLERWLHEWDTFILIMAVGVLTGLIVFMAFNPSPASCQRMVVHSAGRTPLSWVCEHP